MGLLDFFVHGTFKHGIHPAYHKAETSCLPIRRLPFPARLVLPLNQHIGKPAIPLVKKGQEVVRGEPVASADGFMSIPIHAPATGRVKAIELSDTSSGPKALSIVIDVFQSASQEILWSRPRDMDAMSPTDIIESVQQTGMVGLGGAAFPSHVKLTIPEGQNVDTLVVNGCECEPYLSCDHRVMLEYTDDLIRGVQYAMRATQTECAVIGVENNKPDAIEAIRNVLPADGRIMVKAVRTKYPQGSEKMLIKAALGREVPAGGLPSHIGAVVNNVSTLAALGHLLPAGEGMTERVITVAGPGVERPGNYLVPIGTTLGFVLEQVDYQGSQHEYILGGPMMGTSVSSMDTPVTKGTSGILLLSEPDIDNETRRIWPCIKCARCVDACPMHLNPSMLGQLAAKRQYETMADDYHLNDCFECGCCSYVCPSGIPLVQYFRIAKAINREMAA